MARKRQPAKKEKEGRYNLNDNHESGAKDPVPDVMPPTKSKRKRQSFQGEAITEDEPGSKIIRKSANHSEDTTEREKEPSVNLVEAKKRKRTPRALLSDEQKQKKRDGDKQCRERRKNRLVKEDNIEDFLEHNRQYAKKYRESMTPEQKKRELIRKTARQKARRALLSEDLLEKKREQKRAYDLKRKNRLAKEDKLEDFLEKNRQYARKYRQYMTMTPKQKQARRDYNRQLWRVSQKFRDSRSAWASQEVKCFFCNKTLKRGSLNGHVKIHERFAAKMLPLTQEQRNQIEADTTEGSKSKNWHKVRQGRITASRAHRIIRNQTACKYGIAEDMTKASSAYGYTSKAMQYGIDKEKFALERYRQAAGIRKENFRDRCGFVIHKDHPNIGATPDGMILDGGTVEIKCPIVCPDEVATRKSGKFLVKSDGSGRGKFLHRTYTKKEPNANPMMLRRSDPYFTQVVLQIICSDSPYGMFVVYFEDPKDPEKYDVWAEKISRQEADKLWPEFEEKMVKFYTSYISHPSLLNVKEEIKRGKISQSVIKDFFQQYNDDVDDASE